MENPDYIIVFVTIATSEEAELIASALLERKLIARASIISG